MKKLFVAAMLLTLLGSCTEISDNMERDRLFEREGALVKRGETFFGLAGGACFGPCPIYEIYVFETGRVIFNGRRFTSIEGVVESRIDPAGYQELGALLKKNQAFGWYPRVLCATDHPTFDVYDSRADKLRSAAFDYGCNNQAEVIESVEAAFVRISNSASLIKDPNKKSPGWPPRQ